MEKYVLYTYIHTWIIIQCECVMHIYIFARDAWGLKRGNINYQGFGIINYHQLSGYQPGFRFQGLGFRVLGFRVERFRD